jgi:glyoxylase-like metal-dependent hydrolase (beta-lactamase superfamily II)
MARTSNRRPRKHPAAHAALRRHEWLQQHHQLAPIRCTRRVPKEYKAPNLTYSDKMTLRVGKYQFVLTHAKGETDDHTWIWTPKVRIVYTGDLFIWVAPNAGNPQKVQRYVI